VRDRDATFTDTFAAIFASQGIGIRRSPMRAPPANAFAERWDGTVGRELLGRACTSSASAWPPRW
jgi:hypothetical protein